MSEATVDGLQALADRLMGQGAMATVGLVCIVLAAYYLKLKIQHSFDAKVELAEEGDTAAVAFERIYPSIDQMVRHQKIHTEQIAELTNVIHQLQLEQVKAVTILEARSATRTA